MALFGRLEGGKMCFGKHRLDDTKDLNVDQPSCLSNGTSDTRHTQFRVMNYWYQNIVVRLQTLSENKFTAQTPKFRERERERKKKKVALIMLIIALQFDVSTSCKMNKNCIVCVYTVSLSQLRNH